MSLNVKPWGFRCSKNDAEWVATKPDMSRFGEAIMGQEFYLEIGSEEIPAGYILPAVHAMSCQMIRFLDDQRIAHGEPYTAGTPRRLVMMLPEVAPRQESCVTE